MSILRSKDINQDSNGSIKSTFKIMLTLLVLQTKCPLWFMYLGFSGKFRLILFVNLQNTLISRKYERYPLDVM